MVKGADGGIGPHIFAQQIGISCHYLLREHANCLHRKKDSIKTCFPHNLD